MLEGKIKDIGPEGVTIFVPYKDINRLCKRQYDTVQVGFEDGRSLGHSQRRKAYALMGEIAEWSGVEPEEVKDMVKHQFITQHLDGLQKELFSLSDVDMTTAREFISYLIDFIVAWEVPTKVPLVDYCEDIRRYVYTCLTHKQCAVCGKRPCDLHHVDRVGMGNDRRKIVHIGRRCLPLCREHHQMIDHMGDEHFMDHFHLEAVEIDEKILKIYKLNQRGKEK